MGRRTRTLTLGRVGGLIVAILVALALVAPPASAHGRGSDAKHRPSHSNSQSSRSAQHHKAANQGKKAQKAHRSGATNSPKSPDRPAHKSTSPAAESGKSAAANREQRRPSAADWDAADSAERTVSTPVPLPTATTAGLQSSSGDTGLLGGLLGDVTNAAGGLLGGLVGGLGNAAVHVGGALGGALGNLLGTNHPGNGPKPVPAQQPTTPPTSQPAQPSATPPPASPGQAASHGGQGALPNNTQRPGSQAPAAAPTPTLRTAPTTAPALQERPTATGSSSQAPSPVSNRPTPPIAAPNVQNASLGGGVTLPLLGVLLLFALGVLAVVVTAGYRGRRVH